MFFSYTKFKYFTFFFFYLIFIPEKSLAQFRDLNVYIGAQAINVSILEELVSSDKELSFKKAKAAFSSECSMSYLPFNTEQFYFQIGLKYFRLKEQQRHLEYFSNLNGIDLTKPNSGWDLVYDNFNYGFNFQYATINISPTYSFSISKTSELTIGVAGLVYWAATLQKGFDVRTDPNTYAISVLQFEGNYTDIGLAYNLSAVLFKPLNEKVSLSLKAEYNFIKTTIGEERQSVLVYGNANFINERGVSVPIHRQQIDLSGFNLMIGVSFRLSNIDN